MERRTFILLIAIFIVGYFLRVIFLPQNSLTFGYDQGRDALASLEIVHGHFKIFGPSASQPGLFHGVLYYYVLALFYLIGKGSPIVAAYGIAFINALVIFLVYGLTYLMTKRKVTSLIAAFLFAISFEATQYATWLSNPTIGIFTVPLMYLGVWMWINDISLRKQKYIGPILAAIGLGFSIQAEVFLLYHIVPLAIWLWVARRKVTRKQLIIFGGFLLMSVSTMVLAQLKFGIGATINGVKGLAVGENANLAYAKSIGDYLILYLNQIGRIFSFNSYPGNIGYGGGFVIGLIGYTLITKIKNVAKGNIDAKVFVATWLLSHLTVVTVGGTSTPFLMVGIGPAVAIMIALFVGEWWNGSYKQSFDNNAHKALVIVLLLILTFGNISMILRENKNGATLFSIQKDMLLSKQMGAIDYTYEKANKQPFSINTLTSPLWINTTWNYLYRWYGENKYGYLPTWHGRGQEGIVASLDADSFSSGKSNIKTGFLILEPLAGIPARYLDDTLGAEDVFSKVVSEKSFGEIRVQERNYAKRN